MIQLTHSLILYQIFILQQSSIWSPRLDLFYNWISLSMHQQYWHLSQICYRRILQHVSTEAYCSSRWYCRAKTIMQWHSSTLAEPPNICSMIATDSLLFIFFTPKTKLVFEMTVDNIGTVVDLIVVKYCVLGLCESVQWTYVIPAVAVGHIDCDVSIGGLYKFDSASFIEWGCEVCEERYKGLAFVSKTMQPYEWVFGFSKGECDGVIDCIPDDIRYFISPHLKYNKMDQSSLN